MKINLFSYSNPIFYVLNSPMKKLIQIPNTLIEAFTDVLTAQTEEGEENKKFNVNVRYYPKERPSFYPRQIFQ